MKMGVPGLGRSFVTCPRRLANTAYAACIQSADSSNAFLTAEVHMAVMLSACEGSVMLWRSEMASSG